LTGTWAGTGYLVGDDEVAWLMQLGDCVYGTVTSAELNSESGSKIVRRTLLSGRVAPDVAIPLDVVIVSQPGGAHRFAAYSTMTMLIEWEEDGRIRLREDRERGVEAARCRNMQCPGATTAPIPVIWYRIDEGPAT
jgi:hypothetical protein